MTDVVPDSPAALAFLQRFQPEGPWALAAIPPEKGAVYVATFMPGQEQELLAWVEKRNGHLNLYFHVNEVAGRLTKKADKSDMRAARWLHVDIDPRPGEDIEEERDRARRMLLEGRKGVPPATVVLFSGGGYQGFWRLEEPYPLGDDAACEQFERYNRELEQVFGADHCHNVDRIMRLPGSVNIPDKNKLKKGRVAALAKVEFFDDSVYALGTFKQAPPKVERQTDGKALGADRMVTIGGNVPRLTDVSQLDDYRVPDRVKQLIIVGHLRDVEGPKKDDSRSSWLFDCLCCLARAQVPDDLIYGIITDANYGISASVLDKKGGADRYARRQIHRAKEMAHDPVLCEMNDKHAVIGNLGGRCRVVEEVEHTYVVDGETVSRSVLAKQSFEDFRNRYMNRMVEVGKDDDGKPKFSPLGKWWLERPQRRQYEGLIFSPNREVPGFYNLWRGFAYDPVPGDCSMYLEHLRENICGGNEEEYEYLLNWMARGIQYPGSTGQVAVVLRGGMGTGKGTFVRHYLRLFGRHGLQVTSVKHFLGNFNAHLRDVVALFADEAFFAGDKAHESLLKSIVTEETIMYEPKGVDAEPGPNYVHLIMASNSDWVLPMGPKDRRFFVLDVRDAKQQDATYFEAMQKQMSDGGYSALLHLLLERDISKFQVRNYPRNAAQSTQRELTLDPMEEWWLSRLREGAQHERLDHWHDRVMMHKLTDSYVENARKFNIVRRGNETQLGRFLRKYVPDLTTSRPRISVPQFDERGEQISYSRQVLCMHFPSLEKCRAHFEKVAGLTIQWDPAPPEDETGARTDGMPF